MARAAVFRETWSRAGFNSGDFVKGESGGGEGGRATVVK